MHGSASVPVLSLLHWIIQMSVFYISWRLYYILLDGDQIALSDRLSCEPAALLAWHLFLLTVLCRYGSSVAYDPLMRKIF